MTFVRLLSTHADRQGVGISFTVCLCVCTVTDFSDEDKARGVKFCAVVHLHRRPGQGISQFGGTLLPRCPKSDESASHREVKFTMGNAHRKRRARDVDRPMLTALFVSSSCVFVSYSYFVFVLFS